MGNWNSLSRPEWGEDFGREAADFFYRFGKICFEKNIFEKTREKNLQKKSGPKNAKSEHLKNIRDFMKISYNSLYFYSDHSVAKKEFWQI